MSGARGCCILLVRSYIILDEYVKNLAVWKIPIPTSNTWIEEAGRRHCFLLYRSYARISLFVSEIAVPHSNDPYVFRCPSLAHALVVKTYYGKWQGWAGWNSCAQEGNKNDDCGNTLRCATENGCAPYAKVPKCVAEGGRLPKILPSNESFFRSKQRCAIILLGGNPDVSPLVHAGDVSTFSFSPMRSLDTCKNSKATPYRAATEASATVSPHTHTPQSYVL